ncbi:hypothetical protein ACFX13_007020 [Malus domestica]
MCTEISSQERERANSLGKVAIEFHGCKGTVVVVVSECCYNGRKRREGGGRSHGRFAMHPKKKIGWVEL